MLGTIIAAFSLKKNIRKLFSTKNKQSMSCVNGLRVLAIVWVILGHFVEWADWALFSNICSKDKN
jgi:hypothetical protein